MYRNFYRNFPAMFRNFPQFYPNFFRLGGPQSPPPQGHTSGTALDTNPTARCPTCTYGMPPVQCDSPFVASLHSLTAFTCCDVSCSRIPHLPQTPEARHHRSAMPQMPSGHPHSYPTSYPHPRMEPRGMPAHPHSLHTYRQYDAMPTYYDGLHYEVAGAVPSSSARLMDASPSPRTTTKYVPIPVDGKPTPPGPATSRNAHGQSSPQRRGAEKTKYVLIPDGPSGPQTNAASVNRQVCLRA